MIDEKYYKQAVKSKSIDDSLLKVIRVVPCYHEFIRYVQWHNFASSTVQELNLPTLVLHYENYATKFNDTLHSLLHFLGFDDLTLGSAVLKFVDGKSYMSEYYNISEVKAAQSAMEKLASSNIWDKIKHYFPSP
mmetsp:Transcript_1288/g.2074  ORF Transcript_1288/g.2074 Transcript_1288/m.2074 type:complete len:134 (+) Transcript_1288:543-944(+)